MLHYFKYRWRLGMWAWVLGRLSGLALVFYLTLHLWVIHHLAKGEASFNRIMELFANPIFKLLEICLIGTVLYHAFNGLRVILVDLVVGIEKQKTVFWVLMCIGALLFLYSGYRLFPFK